MVNAGIELASHDTKVGNIICQNEQQLEDLFLDVIKNGQQKNEISGDKNAQALARFLSNTVKGMQVSGRGTANAGYFDDIIDTALLVLD